MVDGTTPVYLSNALGAISGRLNGIYFCALICNLVLSISAAVGVGLCGLVPMYCIANARRVVCIVSGVRCNVERFDEAQDSC